MENREEILQYLKKNGKSRAFQIIKNVSAPRREVFRLLKILRKRGQIKHEGFHPKIYYTYISGLEEAQANKPKAVVPSKAVVSKETATTTKSEISYQDLYDCQNELRRLKVKLKSTEAMVTYQEKVIAELKARAERYLKEANKLRAELLKPKGK